MRMYKKKIFTALYLIVALVAMSLSSCKSDPGFSNPVKLSKTYLMLNISPVSTRVSNPDEVTEMIESLRIVIIDTDNQVIECNHYVPFNDSDISEPIPVSNFKYFYTWETFPGNKRVYLIANEASVTNISLQPANGFTPPANLPNNLPGILNSDSFIAGLETGGADFINIMNAIYFSPTYQADSNNDMFIPYVSFYDENIPTSASAGTDVIQFSTYIVPVATKFSFRFNNYRSYKVYIDKIELSGVNNSNFLFARVGTKDYTKSLTDQEGNTRTGIYWVDWLAQVSSLSNGYSGYYPNLGFNELYGWISDYSMPDQTELSPVSFVSTPADSPIPIPQIGVDGVTPGIVNFGPYYVPESKNLITYTSKDENNNDVVVTEQAYYLTLGLSQDERPGSQIPSFTNVAIENLRSLFRNTNVVITVNLNQGNVEIFGMVADWTEKSANGWVVKE